MVRMRVMSIMRHVPSLRMQGAIDTAAAVMQMGVPVARMELLDGTAIRGVNAYSGTSLTTAPTLFFEFHGSAAGVQEQVVSPSCLGPRTGQPQKLHGFGWCQTVA